MTTLNLLPFDIKYTILLHIDDRDTLLDLVSTSRPFYDVFLKYKRRIMRNVVLSEALGYGPDSYMFAFCRRALHALDNIRQLLTIVHQYDWYIKSGVSPHNHKKTGSFEKSEMATYLVEDYIGIRKIAQAYQFAARDFLKEPALTRSELRRIIQAIYRAWTLVLLYHCRDTVPGVLPTLHDQNYIERLILNWPFWEALQIRSVIMELKILPIGKIDVMRPGFAQDLDQDYQDSALPPIMAAARNARPEMTLLNPALSYGARHILSVKASSSRPKDPEQCFDTYVIENVSATPKLPDAYFTLHNIFAEYLFINETPATLAPLYAPDPRPGATAVYNALAKNVPNQIVAFLKSDSGARALGTAGTFRLDAFDTLRYAITRIAKEYKTQPLEYFGYAGEVPLMRLIDTRGPDTPNVFSRKAKMVGSTSWIRRARIGNCVFDDWRLEARGLQFPVFK